ncbi:MAG: sel1 repeat family protein [Candidatus Cloacimonetes bacterium]|nr:sel1 repeat family protein [Candidatus Cloacimonadota bacterium]
MIQIVCFFLLRFFAVASDIPEELLELGTSGNLKAQMIIASRFHADKNYRQSGRWLLLAARQNHAPAMYELGKMYKLGLGTTPDPEKAKMWFTKASELGHTKALQEITDPSVDIVLGEIVPQDSQKSTTSVTTSSTLDTAENHWSIMLKHLENLSLNEAVQAAKKAHKLSTDPISSEIILETLIGLKFLNHQYNDCILLADSVLKNKTDFNLLQMRARSHYLLGNYKESLSDFTEYIGVAGTVYVSESMPEILATLEPSGEVRVLASPEFSVPVKHITNFYLGDHEIHFNLKPEAKMKFETAHKAASEEP